MSKWTCNHARLYLSARYIYCGAYQPDEMSPKQEQQHKWCSTSDVWATESNKNKKNTSNKIYKSKTGAYQIISDSNIAERKQNTKREQNDECNNRKYVSIPRIQLRTPIPSNHTYFIGYVFPLRFDCWRTCIDSVSMCTRFSQLRIFID